MSNLTDRITGFVGGDDFEIRRTITGIPSTQTLTDGWLTVKSSLGDADPGVLQKHITASNVAGVGQIEDNGAGDGEGVVRFDLGPVDTALLVPVNPNVPFYFDVQVKTSAGKVYTPVKGTIKAEAQVTQASS